MKEQSFACLQGLGEVVEAQALVSMYTFSPRYDLDRVDGVFSRAGHPLLGSRSRARFWSVPAFKGELPAAGHS